MSHVLKIFLRILHTRIYKKCEFLLEETQFGFQNGVGTREALFSLNVLMQRCRDMNVDVYASFIDYQKAFDSINHEKLIEVLKSTGIDKQEITIISNLYWRQCAEVRVEQSTSEQIIIEKGVRQGCILSPLLFNLYSEAVFREALDEVPERGVRVNGVVLNNLRYADDTVLIAESPEDLQAIMDAVVRHSNNNGLSLNVTKTKVLVFSKQRKPVDVVVNGSRLEQVSSYKYLGAQVNEQCDCKKEIRARIELARSTFFQMRNFFTRRDLSLDLRMRMVRCYVFSVLLYGCESWTLDPGIEKNIEAFEMYIYRRMLRIPWVEKVTNMEVLGRMCKSVELLLTLKERKTRYIGHVMRGDRYSLLRLIIEGRILGKRSVGRRKNSWLKDLRRWYNCSSIEIFRAAVDREELAIWIANLRLETAN